MAATVGTRRVTAGTDGCAAPSATNSTMRRQIVVAQAPANQAACDTRGAREEWQQHLVRTAAMVVIMFAFAVLETAEAWVLRRLPLYARARGLVVALVDAW